MWTLNRVHVYFYLSLQCGASGVAGAPITIISYTVYHKLGFVATLLRTGDDLISIRLWIIIAKINWAQKYVLYCFTFLFLSYFGMIICESCAA